MNDVKIVVVVAEGAVETVVIHFSQDKLQRRQRRKEINNHDHSTLAKTFSNHSGELTPVITTAGSLQSLGLFFH